MRTYRQLAMGLLALLLCIALPSCSDDDDMDNPFTNELTLSWEVEVNDDLLHVADIAYLLYEGKEEASDPQTISAKSTGSKVTGKAPCTLGAYFALAPKETPDTQKASYDLSISVKVLLTNQNGETMASGFSMNKQLKGVPADRIESSLRSLQKLLDSAESIYVVDASGQVQATSPIPAAEKVSDLQVLRAALFYTDDSGQQQPLLGQALDAARPDVLSVRANDLDDAKAMFLRWMPDAKQAIATGDNLTWNLTDETGKTLGNAYFTATDNNRGQIAQITFDAAVQPKGIRQIYFLEDNLWPVNSALKHRMGDKKRAKAVWKDHSLKSHPDGEIDCYCINNAYDDELAYYVGYSTPSTFHTQEDNDLQKIFPLLPTEQTAKAVQDILNKPKDLGGLGWDYYADWFWEVSKKDIEARSANVWIKRWRKIDGWSIWDYKCYEIDVNNGYQDYELTEHGIPNYFSECWFIHVLVYKGDQLIEGSEIK